MRIFLTKLQKSFDFWFLLFSSFLFFLLRLPSLFEPYWYGDEGVYEVLGFGIRHGRLLYQGIWDNKPPLLYLIYSLFDGNQTYVRALSLLVGLIAVYFFFALAKRLFENKKSIYIAAGIFTLLLALPLLEGNIANAENFMVLPIVAAIFLVVRTLKEKEFDLLSLFFAGLLFGISFLIKVVAVFDFATAFLLITFVVLAWNKKSLLRLFIGHASLTVGFLLPFLATLFFFYTQGAAKVFLQSAFLSNVGYVNYGNQFIIPQGLLILKLLILFIIILFLFIKRRSLSLTQIVMYIWILFSLFNAFFSQRPYTHYVLVLLASFALFIGLCFEKKWRNIHILVVTIILIFLVTNFWFYGKVFSYYGNFVSLLSGQKTVTEYQSFFDKGVPRDYAIADFLRLHLKSNQTVFLWTNSAQIYYLAKRLPIGKYTVAYHMTVNPTTFKETSDALRKASPEFVVILPNAPTFPFRITNYRLTVAIEDGLIYEKVF